jgi:pimeloyl-ACP methyl ester carboxylesterase
MPPAHAGCIVFVHANGFPGGTYRLLHEEWRQAGYDVLAPDKLGHDPHYPVSSNWPQLRDELIATIDNADLGQPAHLVGHSMGGYLSLLVASRRPDLARGVVLLDSPILAGWRAHSVHMAKLTGLMKRVSPGKVSKTRRQHWPSEAAAKAHYMAKSTFTRWDPRVLRDYLRCGIEPAEGGGVRLSFRREIETRIYNTLPHNLTEVLRAHPLRCAVSYLAGTLSREGRQAGMAATRALTHNRIGWIEGTHLFPMEQPELTAKAVLEAIDAQAPAAAASQP